jgi:hypothetical protein
MNEKSKKTDHDNKVEECSSGNICIPSICWNKGCWAVFHGPDIDYCERKLA